MAAGMLFPFDSLFLLVACVAPGGSIPMAQAQRETRLPCQRCIRRLARGREL
jgi:hypothetical protein